jgi:hypothetical protein
MMRDFARFQTSAIFLAVRASGASSKRPTAAQTDQRIFALERSKLFWGGSVFLLMVRRKIVRYFGVE